MKIQTNIFQKKEKIFKDSSYSAVTKTAKDKKAKLQLSLFLEFCALSCLVSLGKSNRKILLTAFSKTTVNDFAQSLFLVTNGDKFKTFLETTPISANFEQYMNTIKFIFGYTLPFLAVKFHYSVISNFCRKKSLKVTSINNEHSILGKNPKLFSDLIWSFLNIFIHIGFFIHCFSPHLLNSNTTNNRSEIKHFFLEFLLSNNFSNEIVITLANISYGLFTIYIDFFYTYQMTVFYIKVKDYMETAGLLGEANKIRKFISQYTTLASSAFVIILRVFYLILG